MRCIDCHQSDFEALWGKFTADFPCSWRYVLGFQQYQREYAGDLFGANLSFVVEDEGNPLAICPLFVERNGSDFLFSWGRGEFLPCPCIAVGLNASTRKKVLDACFARLDELAAEHGIACCKMLIPPYAFPSNVLQQYGFLDLSTACAILDLRQDTDSLHAQIRRRYKPFINKALRIFEVCTVDYTCPNLEIIELYREMHRKAAGRVTRSADTFRIQHEMIVKDQASLIGLKCEGSFVAFSFFLHSGNCAYYGSAADDPDFKSPVPLEHAIIWAAAMYYKGRAFEWYEIGPQPFGPQLLSIPSDKDLSIAFFKRGFGRDLSPLFRGIKYYRADAMHRDLEDGIRKLEDAYWKMFPQD